MKNKFIRKDRSYDKNKFEKKNAHTYNNSNNNNNNDLKLKEETLKKVKNFEKIDLRNVNTDGNDTEEEDDIDIENLTSNKLSKALNSPDNQKLIVVLEHA